MRGAPGLRGQSMAQRLLTSSRPSMTGLGGLKGLPNPKPLTLAQTPASLNISGYGYITTALLTVIPTKTRRDEVFVGSWRQIAGPVVGVCLSPKALATQFNYQIGSTGSYPQTWRCDVLNNYGEARPYDVAFTISRLDDPPAPLVGSGSPSSSQMVPINPTTRIGTCYFSASASGGTPPYSYNWGGGNNPTSSSNSADIYLAPGSGSGIDFSPGCTITDSGSPQQSIVVGAGPFFVYEA